MQKGQKVIIKNTNSVWDGKEGIIEDINEDMATVFVNFIPKEQKRVRQDFHLENLEEEVSNMDEELKTTLNEDDDTEFESDTQTRKIIDALMKYFDVSEDDIEVSSWGDGHDFIVNGDEYWVGTYDEAYEEAVRDARDVLDDLGLDALASDYRDYALSQFADVGEIENWMRDHYEYYINDIEDEQDSDYGSRLIAEMVEEGIISDEDFVDDEIPEDVYENAKEKYLDKLCDQDAVKWLFDNFGEEANKMLIDNNAVDFDAIAEDCVDTDGIAHYIASYDGNEIELDDNLYAYRRN